MIKFDDKSIYLSAGEACYIVSIADGRLTHMYFGKRIEPEDDIAALGLDGGVPEIEVKYISRGEEHTADLRLQNAQIEPNKPTVPHTISGGKTLVVTLADNKSRITAQLYYTAYARGGFTRRVDLQSEKSVKISSVVLSSRIEGDATDTGMSHFATALSGGECFGGVCLFADGEVSVVRTDGTVRMQSVGTAEQLLLYSDCGAGGVTRVLHDILREYDGGVEHVRAVLFLPDMKLDKATDAIRFACELGFDVAAVNMPAFGERDVAKLAEDGKAIGIGLGVRITADGADIDSVKRLIASGAVSYVLIDSDKKSTAAVRQAFAMRARLLDGAAHIVVDCALQFDPEHLRRCVPPGSVRNIITPAPANSFKQRFDMATTGSLGYEFDPAALSDNVKRAVRAQILSYQDDAPAVYRGDMYEVDGGVMFVSKDKSKAYAVTTAEHIKLVGLDEHNLYNVREKNKTFSGAALCSCGITVDGGTLHLRQVADWE